MNGNIPEVRQGHIDKRIEGRSVATTWLVTGNDKAAPRGILQQTRSTHHVMWQVTLDLPQQMKAREEGNCNYAVPITRESATHSIRMIASCNGSPNTCLRNASRLKASLLLTRSMCSSNRAACWENNVSQAFLLIASARSRRYDAGILHVPTVSQYIRSFGLCLIIYSTAYVTVSND